MGSSAASRITKTNANFYGSSLGQAGGDERLHGHTHGAGTLKIAYDGGGTAGIAVDAGDGFPSGSNANVSGNTGTTGSGSSQNVQPSIVKHWMIKT
jgi:hypothetical protein